MSKFFLVLLGLCCFRSASAQLNWKSKGPLYEDKYITVEIEYAMGENPCGAGEVSSQYRYKITRLKSHGEFFINWRFDYFNCDHQLKTHANSLQVTKATKVGYIVPEGNRFSAFKLANNFNEVKQSPRLPDVTAYEPRSPISLEPKAITGNLAIDRGEATKLTFLGGYLAPNTTWKWHEGNCDGQLIGTGTSIIVHPLQTTTYALQGEGQSPTSCVWATVMVSNTSLAATAIDGKSQFCEGEKNIKLMVTGGKLGDGAKWVWYQDNCGGMSMGEGDNIYVSPLKTTTYYVRAEGPGGNTVCQAHELSVTTKSKTAELIDGPNEAVYGDVFTLSVRGGELAADAKWVWYSGSAGHQQQLGTGRSFKVAFANADQMYYVRAEGGCYNSEFVSKSIRVRRRQRSASSLAATSGTAVRSTTFFINGGVVANNPDQLKSFRNYVATVGGGKNTGWFVRAKINGDQSRAAYESAGMQITDYNLPGYYRYNNQKVSKRAAYTGGIYLGGRNLAVYLGGGYGSRELLYGIGQYNYGSSLSDRSTWVKNTMYSYSGAEIEGGLVLKMSFFNMMGGVSTIQGKYTDYNLGIGFNL